MAAFSRQSFSICARARFSEVSSGAGVLVEEQQPRTRKLHDRHQRRPRVLGPLALREAALVPGRPAGKGVHKRQVEKGRGMAGDLLHVVEPPTGIGVGGAGHKGHPVEGGREGPGATRLPRVADRLGNQGRKQHRGPALPRVLVAADDAVERPFVEAVAAGTVEKGERIGKVAGLRGLLPQLAIEPPEAVGALRADAGPARGAAATLSGLPCARAERGETRF